MYYLADFSFLRDLAKRALRKRQIPPVPLIRKGLGDSLLTAIKNPSKVSETIKDGLVVDKVANSFARRMGKTRLGLTGQGIKKVVTSKPSKELLVNTAGAIASSTPLGLAGDLLGSVTTRKAIDDSIALNRAYRKSKLANPNLNLPNRTRDVLTRSRKIVRSIKRLNNNPYLGDTVGWGIGNTAASSIPLNIPLRGAAVAMSTGDIIEKGIRNTLSGTPIKKSLLDAGEAFKKRFNIREQIEKGLTREEQMRQRLNRKLVFPPSN